MISEDTHLSNEELVSAAHDLAVKFYRLIGYEHKNSHRKLYDSQHPTEQAIWRMACVAFDEIRGSDVECALEELRGDS